MATDIVGIFETFNLVMILVAFAVFARLAFKGKSLGKFRFQLSIFLLIWVLSEIPHISLSLALVATAGYEDLGLYLHALSLGAVALFVGWRSIDFAPLHPAHPKCAFSSPQARSQAINE